MSNKTWYVLTKERVLQTGNSITGLTVKDQVGDAQIDNTTKEVTIKIEDNGANISMITIESLNLSYAATGSVISGETLDFSSGNRATVTVKSETGEIVTWTIKLLIDIDLSDVSIAGIWSIQEIGIYSDLFTWESWGWEKTELLNNYLSGAGKELDNVITFTVEGISADNQPYGTYENNSGTDGEYGDFVSNDATWPETEFNSRFRKIPTNTGTWVLDEVNSKVTITDGSGVEFVLILEVKTGTTIGLTAELEYKSDLFNWTDTNYSYEEVSHMSNKMWYNLSK